jgi:hypothetical protein
MVIVSEAHLRLVLTFKELFLVGIEKEAFVIEKTKSSR